MEVSDGQKQFILSNTLTKLKSAFIGYSTISTHLGISNSSITSLMEKSIRRTDKTISLSFFEKMLTDLKVDTSTCGAELPLLKFLANHNEDVKSVALKNAPQNLKLTSPDIQKDIVNAVAIETINVIISDIGDELFSIMIDESRDISTKEQMTIVFHYVDMDGDVIEHFIRVEHVTSTTALSLKMAIDELFCRHRLSITRLRGYVANVVNVVGASCKHRDILHEKQATMVIETLNNGEIESGWGLNQNTTLKRASDTHDSFASFDKEKLIQLAEFYPRDFAPLDFLKLGDQLNTYIIDMCSNKEFSNLKGFGDLARRMVKTKRDKAYPLVYLLLKLALILPVDTATVERAFPAMNILKTQLGN
ncbi:uncharacterized protein LOC132304740 [Cornus florida]|uniref:uncharacterized protein LOC132304740 n=1 Tax=Cornus florida TaxID=4283 RepID=UPI00289BAD84|nr:uncharacterized protein LOC132304740 [Cornus florida]